jgi:hypothetical protein
VFDVLATRPSAITHSPTRPSQLLSPSPPSSNNPSPFATPIAALPETAFISPPRGPAPISSTNARPFTSPLSSQQSDTTMSSPLSHAIYGSGSIGDCEFIQRRLSAAHLSVQKGALERALLPPSQPQTISNEAIATREQQLPTPFAAVPLNPFYRPYVPRKYRKRRWTVNGATAKRNSTTTNGVSY